ncbi:MAG: stage II sporulation protein M [Holophagales bacterium]|nr:stage II sporulation protein M [Holophagales bacterium]
MDYSRFERLREPVRAELEARLGEARERPSSLGFDGLERLAFLYRQALHDASLAAARFPGTGMSRRLRSTVLAATHWLQRDDAGHLPSPRRFVTHTFPRTFRQLLGPIGVAAALFTTAAAFGFAVTAVEPSAGAFFLPHQTLKELADGQLWTDSIFAVTPGAVVSSEIARNNLSVAITAWAGGALAGFGALYIVFLNGLMLGSVLMTTAHYSLLGGLAEFIAAHGPLEITLILVSAGAGLHMGRALVEAGDRPRSVALREASIEALIVLLGCLPWILLLGFVEGFVSPSRELGAGTKLLLGCTLEGLFLAWALGTGREDAPAPFPASVQPDPAPPTIAVPGTDRLPA